MLPKRNLYGMFSGLGSFHIKKCKVMQNNNFVSAFLSGMEFASSLTDSCL
jgi:hypothetical protein